ncbi:hypothetical protein COCSADRAFT_357471 [Bipolaris sorokiniana ND90Pr]|uniref:Uncharacterized protein n=1 Tax=Cochliobolus sativus (strain ND90Pr / ATCC 201652) TaxID=665912 RepID=M2T5F6_COCSN|nr:uncharacterized protein COCSADRAFT_357471 [Bipolaris sorokiniana ND90Pr]EMD64476.1 hypothetical protein COCSADRAFT_357471 [Bipolaris sorokiniana ND90Pr]
MRVLAFLCGGIVDSGIIDLGSVSASSQRFTKACIGSVCVVWWGEPSNDARHARFVLPVTGASGLKRPTLPMDPEHRPFIVYEAEWASDKDCGTRIGGEERPTPGAACATATPKGRSFVDSGRVWARKKQRRREEDSDRVVGWEDRLALALYPTLGAAQEMRNRLATCLIGPSEAPSNISLCGATNESPPARQPSTGPSRGPAARAGQWIKDAPSIRTRSLTATRAHYTLDDSDDSNDNGSHTNAAGCIYRHLYIDAGA